MKTILLLLIYIVSLQSSVLKMDYHHVNFENFQIEYIIDKTTNLTINQIKKSNFKSINSQNSFSGKVGSVWYKIKLKNLSQTTKKLFLHNNFAYYAKNIEIYEFSNNEMKYRKKYNILRNTGVDKLIGSTLVYSFKVLPGEEKTLYIKNIPMVTSIVNFNIYCQEENLKALLNKTFYSNIIHTFLHKF